MVPRKSPASLRPGGRHAQKSARQAASVVKVTDITPRFKLVFATVFAITVLSLLMNLIIVLAGIKGLAADSFAETCSTAFKLGFGAIVGLVGGKVT